MQQQYLHVLPKSAIGKALAYSLERWHKLSLYTTDGKLNIDNNAVENSIRPVALGYVKLHIKSEEKISCSPVPMKEVNDWHYFIPYWKAVKRKTSTPGSI